VATLYEYKFKKLELKTGFFSMKPDHDYHEIIKEHAEDGWRFVQIFAPSTSAHPNSSYFELVFEREK